MKLNTLLFCFINNFRYCNNTDCPCLYTSIVYKSIKFSFTSYKYTHTLFKIQKRLNLFVILKNFDICRADKISNNYVNDLTSFVFSILYFDRCNLSPYNYLAGFGSYLIETYYISVYRRAEYGISAFRYIVRYHILLISETNFRIYSGSNTDTAGLLCLSFICSIHHCFILLLLLYLNISENLFFKCFLMVYVFRILNI